MHVENRSAVALLAGVLLLFGSAEALHAQNEAPPVDDLRQQSEPDSMQPSSSADLVSVETRLAATPVPAGQAVDGALVLDVEEGWHVNAHRPTFDYLIGTTLNWSASSDVTVDGVQYPEPKRFELDFAGDAIDVYEGRAPIFFNVRPASGTAPGEHRLTGRVRVQACNDRTCLQPSTVTATLSVPVADAGVTPTSTEDPVFEKARSASIWSTVVPIVRQYGLFLAGGMLALGTVLFLVVYSWINPES